MSVQAEKYKEQGNDEFKKGNFDKAIEYYTYATEMDPRNHVFFTNRALCYEKMKKYDKALRDAEKSTQLNKDWEKGHYRRGVALRELGRFVEALDAFEMCQNLNSKNDEYKKAYDDAKKQMYKGMSEAEINKIEGNEFFKRGKIQEAIDKYTKAISGAKGDDEKVRQLKADCYANRAACYVQLYEPQKVRDDCNAALTLVPNHFKALLRRGLALESLEKYKAAVDDFEAALRQHPGDNMAIQALARCKKAAEQMARG